MTITTLNDKSLPHCSEDYSSDEYIYATQKPQKSDEYTIEHKFYDFNGNCVDKLVFKYKA